MVTERKQVIIDAEGAILGRMATFAAKEALKGSKIIVVNADKAIITGNRHALQEVYLNKRQRGGTSQKGPYFSRTPDRIVRKTIRGMLPWEKTTGIEAYKRVLCYIGVPQEYATKEKLSFKKNVTVPHVTVGELSQFI